MSIFKKRRAPVIIIFEKRSFSQKGGWAKNINGKKKQNFGQSIEWQIHSADRPESREAHIRSANRREFLGIYSIKSLLRICSIKSLLLIYSITKLICAEILIFLNINMIHFIYQVGI